MITQRLTRRLAFTLVEMLVVAAIVALLAALLFPVLTSARLAAKKSACIVNLRQASLALSQYLSDQGDYPMELLSPNPDGGSRPKSVRTISPLATYAPGQGVFLCPLDQPQGRRGRPVDDRLQPRSYAANWNLWEGKQGTEAWRKLLTVDANPIIFRCYFHEEYVRNYLLIPSNTSMYGTWLWPTWGLAARLDGSVFYDRREMKRANGIDGFPVEDIKRRYWSSATFQPCPPDICDDKMPPEGVREG